MAKQTIYNAGIYVRLSQEDMRAGESLSIEHQKLILTKYVREQGWNLVDTYVDDGFSGTDFNRPSVQRLLSDAQTGRINLIICKDLSRFGRNYIEVGQYIDYIFPLHNIRFIALNDNVDTANRDSNAMEMMPVINLFNEWHASSTSKKIKAVNLANAKAGKYTCANAAYGYTKADDEKHTPIDPPAMLKRLHENKGLKTCVWINPYVGQRSKLFDEGMKNGYFIKKTDGSVFQCDEWQPGMAIVDFTNPEACKWYAGYLRKLCEMGVDTFKTDFGERIPTRDVVYYDGSDPIKMHNFYTYLYNECVFNVLKEYFGENKACLFARSATAGGQKFPVHWGGDCSGNYNSMAEVVRGCLSLCISGFGYTSHDMAGFEATATPDIYKRWAAFGMFSSHSRLHGNQSYRVPWLFDEESCDVLRFFTKLKGKLMPYLWAQAIKTHEVGVPVMRAMVIDFADDPTCLTLDRQYMFGDNILVAPILNDEGIAEYYVPEGKWTDIITGKVLEGGKWYKHKCSYFEIPALAKPNSIIAYGNFERQIDRLR